MEESEIEDLKLLRLKNEFSRTSALVYANGVKLRNFYERILHEEIFLLNTKLEDWEKTCPHNISNEEKSPCSSIKVSVMDDDIHDDDRDIENTSRSGMLPILPKEDVRDIHHVSYMESRCKIMPNLSKPLVRPFSICLTKVHVPLKTFCKLHVCEYQNQKKKDTQVLEKASPEVTVLQKEYHSKTDNTFQMLSDQDVQECLVETGKKRGSASGNVSLELKKRNVQRRSNISKNVYLQSSSNSNVSINLAKSSMNLRRKTLNYSSLLHDTFNDEDVTKSKSGSKFKIQVNSKSFVAPKLKMSNKDLRSI